MKKTIVKKCFCPKCKQYMADVKFCPICGSEMTQNPKCSCGEDIIIDPDFKYCSNCGKKLEQVSLCVS